MEEKARDGTPARIRVPTLPELRSEVQAERDASLKRIVEDPGFQRAVRRGKEWDEAQVEVFEVRGKYAARRTELLRPFAIPGAVIGPVAEIPDTEEGRAVLRLCDRLAEREKKDVLGVYARHGFQAGKEETPAADTERPKKRPGRPAESGDTHPGLDRMIRQEWQAGYKRGTYKEKADLAAKLPDKIKRKMQALAADPPKGKEALAELANIMESPQQLAAYAKRAIDRGRKPRGKSGLGKTPVK